MATPSRDPIQLFEDCKGINLKNSPLTRTINEYVSLQNFEFSESNSIRGRKGIQGVGARAAFLGTHTYRYFDKATGATMEERLGINAQMFKLATATMTVTQVAGATNWNFQNIRQTTGDYRFTLAQDTTLNTLDLNTGLEDHQIDTLITMWDLSVWIDAFANFTCSKPTQSAKVNGDQVGKTINVDAGHTISAGEYLVFWDYAVSRHRAVWITAITGTSFTFVGGTDAQVFDNQTVGLGAVPAAFYPVDTYSSLTTTNPKTISFDYWKHVPCPEFSRNPGFPTEPFASFEYMKLSEFFRPPVFVDAANCCYVFFNQSLTLRISGIDPIKNGPRKYDSQNVYMAGDQTIPLITPTTAAGAVTGGEYKYLIRSFTIDHQGNEIFGKIDIDYPAKLTAAAAVKLQFAAELSSILGLNNKGGVKDTTETGTVLKVDDGAGGPHSFEVGDYATFNNSTGAWIRTKITAVNRLTAPYTITVSDSVTVNDGDNMSNGHGVLIYRTLAGGSELYEAGRYPLRYNSAVAWNWVDNNTDAQLEAKARFENLTPNKEVYDYSKSETEQQFSNYSLAPTSIGCVHQNLLVMSGDPRFPNTIYKTSLDRPEAINEAFGSFEIPSTIQGPITCVVSDADDALVVAKQTSLFYLSGEFEENIINTVAITEGDFGTASPLGMAKVKGIIRGVGQLGAFKITNGKLALEESIYLEGSLGGNPCDKVDLRCAIVYNDINSHGCRIFIPGWNTASSRRHFLLDYYNKDIWFDWKYASIYYDPVSGIDTYKGLRHHASRQAQGGANLDSGFNWKECAATNSIAENYTDGTQVIPYRILSTAINLNSPKLDKQFVWFTLFSFLLDNEIPKFTGFTLLLKTYRNFQTTDVHTSKQVTFSAVTDYEKPTKLLDGKSKALTWELTNVNAKECPYITGWELLVTESHKLDSHKT